MEDHYSVPAPRFYTNKTLGFVQKKKFVEPQAVPALVPESYEGQTGLEVSSLSGHRQDS